MFRLLPTLAATVSLWAAAAPSASAATPITVELRGSAPLPTTAVDQHGATFNVAGLSGITHRGGVLFTAVMDNSNKLVHLNVKLAANGSIESASFAGGISLSQSRDYEGIAYTHFARGSAWLADEGTPRLDEIDLETGALVRSVAAPSVFSQRRSGFGWESLSRKAGGSELWTANEEALTVDGPLASPTAGTIVRLARFAASGDSYTVAEQYAYPVDPWHAGESSLTSAERSGLVDLVQLPDGRLLALERSLAFTSPITPSFENRLYEIDLAGATNVASMATLIGASYTPAAKRLIWTGTAAGAAGMNMEGLTVGPRLENGNLTLLGVVDDGGTSDFLSTNTLVAFEITSEVADPATAGDANLDGLVDAADVAAFARSYGANTGGRWEDGDFDGDGAVTLADLALLASHLPVPESNHATQLDPKAELVPTPEPGGMVLAIASLTALLSAGWLLRLRKNRQSTPARQSPVS
jgi:hypothetical protein